MKLPVLAPVRMLAAFTAVITLAGLVAVIGCNQNINRIDEIDPDVAKQIASIPPLDPPDSGFVGSEACRSCHAAEFGVQHRTHHAQTLRPATRASLGSLAPPTGPIGETGYAIEEKEGAFYFKSVAPGGDNARIEYALGSGIANITYVGRIDSNRLTEFRLSYNPGRKRWFITPGQEATEDIALGSVHAKGIARRCIHCHSDSLASGTNAPAPQSAGVGCESCHGPGAKHIAAVQDGSPPGNLQIQNPGKLTPHEVNMACAKCHRSIDDISLNGLDAVDTPRFQPYAIEISPCYRKSGNRLSCITCHDPHTDASTDLQHYEKVCLSCHNASVDHTQKSCPVTINPAGGCIGCHMPQRRVLPATRIPLTMTDHLIWAYKPLH